MIRILWYLLTGFKFENNNNNFVVLIQGRWIRLTQVEPPIVAFVTHLLGPISDWYDAEKVANHLNSKEVMMYEEPE